MTTLFRGAGLLGLLLLTGMSADACPITGGVAAAPATYGYRASGTYSQPATVTRTTTVYQSAAPVHAAPSYAQPYAVPAAFFTGAGVPTIRVDVTGYQPYGAPVAAPVLAPPLLVNPYYQPAAGAAVYPPGFQTNHLYHPGLPPAQPGVNQPPMPGYQYVPPGYSVQPNPAPQPQPQPQPERSPVPPVPPAR